MKAIGEVNCIFAVGLRFKECVGKDWSCCCTKESEELMVPKTIFGEKLKEIYILQCQEKDQYFQGFFRRNN